MGRPPLANIFAIHDPDSAALDAFARDLQQGGEFTQVWRPGPGWVAAAAPLPDGTPDDDSVQQQQLAFAEGRDLLVDDNPNPGKQLRQIVELADHHPEDLDTLPGDFGFIRFRANGEATVVRSCGGLVPFYIKQTGTRWVISTQLGNFVRYLPEDPQLDPLVNAIWSASWAMFPDGRTFLKGISLLDRGHYAILNKNRQTGAYWNPRPDHTPYPSRDQEREHAERLRTLLISKLERDLDPTGGNLLTLSGGVDSSSLAALAGGVVGRDLMLWSLVPRKERQDLLAHHMSFIDPLAEKYGFDRRWAVHGHERLVLDLWQDAPKIVFHVLHPALCSLPKIMQEAPVRVLVGGEFADAVCGSRFTLPDWAQQTSPLRLLTHDQWLRKNPRGLALWARYRLAMLRGKAPLPFPRELLTEDLRTHQPLNLYHPTVQDEYHAWWDGKQKELLADHRPWRNLALRCATQDAFVTLNWEVCSALGIRRSFPFFNREALELAFECHPTELYGPHPGAKKLLRAALHNDVPHRNLYRIDKSVKDKGAPELKKFVQGPLPKGGLPEELAAVLHPDFFANPPHTLEYQRLRRLTRLILFENSLHTRRGECLSQRQGDSPVR